MSGAPPPPPPPMTNPPPPAGGAPPPAWTPAPGPAPGWAPPPAAPANPPRKTLIIVGVVVVVVIIVLLAGLYAASVGPFSKSGSGSSTGAGGSETFSQAASTATPSASGVSGGPWTLVGGVGALAGSSFTTNASYFESEATTSGCGGKLLSGASSITSFPSSSNAPGSGATPFWLVLFKNSSGGVLEVAVISGTATPVVTFTAFGSCGNALSLTQASSYIDSPQAAADAMDYGGNTFASAHSAFYTIYVLVPGDSLTYSGHVGNIPPSWEIELTNCNPAQTTSATLDGKAPAQFHASLNVTTGKLITATNDTAACVVSNPGGGGGGGKPSLSSTILVPFDFIETNNSNTTSPVYWNNGTFVSSWSGQFTIGEFTVAIENNTTGAPISTAGLTLNFFNITNLINGTGVADAVYHFGTNTWSSNTALVGKIQNHDFFEVISSASLAGDKLVITATSAAPVSGSYAGILAEY